MSKTEITNYDRSEKAILIDVHDLLQGAPDDRTKARVLNRHQWVAVGNDDVEAQIDGNKMWRATGSFGKPDARIHVDGEPLWDVRLDETSTVVFRTFLTVDGERRYTALWFYWESDMADLVPVYREDLDVDAVGEQAAKYARSAMYRDLLHVPIYDDQGLIVLVDEDPETGEGLLEGGVAEVESERVMAYKNRVLSARVDLPHAEAAAEFQSLLWSHCRMRSARAEKALANRMFLEGEDLPLARKGRGERTVKPASSPVERKARAAQAAEAPAAPKKGFLARLGFGK